jgi:signal transduction histidine kinase
LVLAIQTHCKEFTNRTQLPVNLALDPSLPQIPDVYNVIIYRILQEALNNIVKHAQASRVWVELSLDDECINLTIQDNGRGLPDNQSQTDGIGITGMKERLALVGGKLLLHSPVENGTILSASLPLKPAPSVKEAP